MSNNLSYIHLDSFSIAFFEYQLLLSPPLLRLVASCTSCCGAHAELRDGSHAAVMVIQDDWRYAAESYFHHHLGAAHWHQTNLLMLTSASPATMLSHLSAPQPVISPKHAGAPAPGPKALNPTPGPFISFQRDSGEVGAEYYYVILNASRKTV